MNAEEIVPLLGRSIMAFITAFLGIALWAKTRDEAWILVVLGSFFLFIEALYATLAMVGLVDYELLILFGYPLLRALFSVLPPLFMGLGFLLFLLRK